MKTPRLLCLSVLLLGILSCARLPLTELVSLDPESLRPPEILGVSAEGRGVIEARFTKDAWIDKESWAIDPPLEVRDIEDGNPCIRFLLDEEGLPGKEYSLEARVKDERGNTASFLYRFYGFNSRLPQICINEFILTSASTVLTQVEIAVLSDGDMGGMTFFEGTKTYPDKTFLFPSFEVKAGDFILLHFKPEGLPGEIDETNDTTLATGKGASDLAYDFWAAGTGNLSADNDVLSVYTNPNGRLVDAVLYTSKTFEEGMKYNGFGTSLMLNKVMELQADSGWVFSGATPLPSDGVNPEGSTSRRSLCRSQRFDDTNRREDWHIVPSGSATFGAVNSDEVYSPD